MKQHGGQEGVGVVREEWGVRAVELRRGVEDQNVHAQIVWWPPKGFL